MNLHALRIFHRIARVGGVTRAAESLLLSQPAATQQLRNLEKELGVKLVEPDGRGIRLTFAGRELYELAGRLFAVEQEIEHRMREISSGTAGELTIAATYLPATVLIPKCVASFKAKHDARINVLTCNTREAFEMVNSRTADVAVIGGGWEQPNVSWRHLLDDELWFVVPPDHPLANREVSLQEMMNETFVIREEGSSTRERFLALCRTYNVRQPRIGMQLNGLYETIKAVGAGYGANLISAMAVREFVERGEVSRVYVRGVELRRPIAVCSTLNEELKPLAAAFVKALCDSVPARR